MVAGGSMQTRKGSITESISNVGIGYAVALASQMVIFPAYGIHIPINTNIKIGIWFTVVSIIRSYALRRVFNKIGARK